MTDKPAGEAMVVEPLAHEVTTVMRWLAQHSTPERVMLAFSAIVQATPPPEWGYHALLLVNGVVVASQALPAIQPGDTVTIQYPVLTNA